MSSKTAFKHTVLSKNRVPSPVSCEIRNSVSPILILFMGLFKYMFTDIISEEINRRALTGELWPIPLLGGNISQR